MILILKENKARHSAVRRLYVPGLLTLLLSAAMSLTAPAAEASAEAAAAEAAQLPSAPPEAFVPASPDQLRSEKEWAMLRDNRLDWEEIAGLVEEYSPEIRKEKAAWEKNEARLKTAEEIADSLARAAEEYEVMAELCAGEPGEQLTAARLRLQAENLREQAADSTGDQRVFRLGMRKSLLSEEKEVRNLFVDYCQADHALRNNRAETEWLQQQAEEVRLHCSRGLAAASSLTEAEAAVRKNRAKQESLETEKKNAYRKLIMSCGWSGDAQAEIGPLPTESSLILTAAEQAEGREKALEASIRLQEDRIRLENAQRLYGYGNVAERMRAQLEQDTLEVSECYQAALSLLQSAERKLSEAKTALGLAERNCAAAEKQLKSGYISQYAHNRIRHERAAAERTVQGAVFDLIRARVAYDTVCRGLTE